MPTLWQAPRCFCDNIRELTVISLNNGNFYPN